MDVWFAYCRCHDVDIHSMYTCYLRMAYGNNVLAKPNSITNENTKARELQLQLFLTALMQPPQNPHFQTAKAHRGTLLKSTHYFVSRRLYW